MRGGVGPTTVQIRSTPEVCEPATFAEWEAVVAKGRVPLRVQPVRQGEFRARIVASRFGAMNVSLVTASGQHISCDARPAVESAEPILFATITTHGHGWLTQDGRVGEMADGGLTLHVSSRPFSAHFEQPWGVVMVQVPLSHVVRVSGVAADRMPTAVRFPPEGAAGIVGRFFCGLAHLQHVSPEEVAVLARHGTGLLASVVRSATVEATHDDPGHDEPGHARLKQQALAHLHRHYADPALTVDRVAAACSISTRMLHRLFEKDGGGVVAMLRRMRVERALALIRTDTTRPFSSVAHASGFVSEGQFHRAFRREIGMTPGEFRAAQR